MPKKAKQSSDKKDARGSAHKESKGVSKMKLPPPVRPRAKRIPVSSLSPEMKIRLLAKARSQRLARRNSFKDLPEHEEIGNRISPMNVDEIHKPNQVQTKEEMDSEEEKTLFAALEGASPHELDVMFNKEFSDKIVAKDFIPASSHIEDSQSYWSDHVDAYSSGPQFYSQDDKEDASTEYASVFTAISKAIHEADDTYEIESFLPDMQREFKLSWIKMEGLGTSRPQVKGKVNPEFFIDISNKEMRGSPSSSGPFSTKAQWQAQQITLDKAYTVGKKMQAYPLGPDTMRGTSASGDQDQKEWMAKTAYGSEARGNFKGGQNRYIRGHLLNDNLGGPANQYNLFPITEDANHQHSNNAEEFIKAGIRNGYVYAYDVEIKNPSVSNILGKPGLYSINSELHFQFARLNAKKEAIRETEHKGVIYSKFGVQTTTEFWEESKKAFKAKTNEEEYTDYQASLGKKKKGSVNDPLNVTGTHNVGGKAIQKPLKTQDDSNYQTSSSSGWASFVSPLFNFGAMAAPVTPVLTSAQAINPAADKSTRISIYKSPEDDVAARFGDKGLVTNWGHDDVKKWKTEVVNGKHRSWDKVKTAAVNNKLDSNIANELFAADGDGRENVTIYGSI